MPGRTITCLRCGKSMIRGHLRGPVDMVHIESNRSLVKSPLCALICPACGYVELRAEWPQALGDGSLSAECTEYVHDSRENNL